ncbi:hypothetical protein A3F00_03015 [Candidatus Daviesbacteria bacterium RIFCSPHIGHO2_12_FULL_37_11]|uniref:Glycosyltransferase RgtA/B/C/D-like domain-containing protein n=1 Tax=Candidatus Daviesbacteria bacterium RIFCSPHIGHO2_12_FULL_37_11 TaxID=1797777 RepID=A0A1F5KBT6_9BACT|nr:MAG: hypothetical protein A2111_03420 [Candidatus Daviesbacteria bacterium GWA1_38_6]OGE16968.1 MAG: hypothetical protein A2769_04305 [Candidatus Daviesbacteria bacterium RIFCSPHIGHO2_01_FULL_37_27]OGE38270.1 MAG: hypothetical protein A3F00_03015 [Candidatus Daviesbacteria bacterium RIFCSPHIGHO2_12_FULL_37_11]OGE46227.1 MAG: hypothetical protein A3B39_02780 [Candidatus Daviesbacteria bacterium RIFCSPLOWO2_01_FULL_37_10]
MKIILLFLILLVAFSLRIIKVDSPIADWHSWRQADTASVTRNFIKQGFNPFYPKGDDMSGIAEEPIANTGHLRFVEFPIYNIAVYPLYLFFGVNEIFHRLVSVFFSMGSIIFLYLVSKKYAGEIVGFLSAFIFAILPFNVFFSRTTLPEPTLIFFSLGMMYFVDRWIWEGKRKLMFLGFLFTSVAFLIKPWAFFFFLPLVYSALKREGSIVKVIKKYLRFFTLSLTPFILWRVWIIQTPEGIPASNWLFNGDGIRFRPAFWWWIISERIGREILGVTGAFLFFLGLLIKPRDGNYFLHIWALSLFLYFITFATGNVRHDYYQIVFVPVAAVFVSIGFIRLIKGVSDFIPRFWSIPMAFLFLTLTIYFTWTQVKELYKVNNPPIIEAGKKADEILPEDAVVVAPYMGDTAFLYQINRIGFPVTALPLSEMVSDYGVTHYVSVNRDDKTNWVLRHFEILEDNPKFVIADLTKIIKPLSIEDKEP